MGKSSAQKAYEKAHQMVLKQDYDGAIKLLDKHKKDKDCQELLFRTLNLKNSVGDFKAVASASDSKSVTVHYGIFNNPNKRGVEKAIKKWGKKGYRLVARNEYRPGIIKKIATFFWARGRTELHLLRIKLLRYI